MLTNYKKSMKKGYSYVDTIINKCKEEIQTKGYRENLGYDQYINLQEKLDGLELVYSDRAKILNYFIQCCDNL